MDDDSDPFASLADLCHVSSSQEEQLRHCRFALEPEADDNPLFPEDSSIAMTEASTGIRMVSPPETPEADNRNDNSTSHDNNDDDVFRTPPEVSTLAISQEERQTAGEPVPVDADCTDDGSRAVDLGRSTDLGFSHEADEATEKIDSGFDSPNSVNPEVIRDGFADIRVSKRELLASNDCSNESPTKKLKTLDQRLGAVTPKPSLGTEIENRVERVVKSMEKLKSPLKKLANSDENVGLEAERSGFGTEAVKILEMLMKSVEVLKTRSRSMKMLGKRLGESPVVNLGSEAEESTERFVKFMEQLQCPSKVLEILKKNFVSETAACSLGTETEGRENLGKSAEKSLDNNQFEEVVDEDNNNKRDDHEECLAKRKLEFSTEVLESDFEENDVDLGFINHRAEGVCDGERDTAAEGHLAGKSIEDIEKFRYVGPGKADSHENGRDDVRGKRRLPESLFRNKNAGGQEEELDVEFSPRNYKEVTLLDVLRMLAEGQDHDPSLDNLSLLEAAKRRGMTFP